MVVAQVKRGNQRCGLGLNIGVEISLDLLVEAIVEDVGVSDESCHTILDRIRQLATI
jgi:hypothetical protein